MPFRSFEVAPLIGQVAEVEARYGLVLIRLGGFRVFPGGQVKEALALIRIPEVVVLGGRERVVQDHHPRQAAAARKQDQCDDKASDGHTIKATDPLRFHRRSNLWNEKYSPAR